jgi:peptide/nickel transport system substrate-binding protein
MDGPGNVGLGNLERIEGITRRALMSRGAQGALAVGAGSLLAACGSTATTLSSSRLAAASHPVLPNTSGTGTPVRGGTLMLGETSGGTSETLNPVLVVANSDVYRSCMLYDNLFVPAPHLKSLIPRLAVSAERNADASVWTVQLRKDVVWHDGTPFTADDVIYTLNYWTGPNSQLASIAAPIDLKRVRKRGPLTVEVPLLAPNAQWPTTTASFLNPIIKAGTKASDFNRHAIGTGPFKFVSFDPGRQSVFEANREYWEEGKPYLDRVIVNSSFTDDNARLNALLAGEINLMPLASFELAKAQMAARQVTVFGSPCLQPYVFTMRVDKGETADVRVRQAMKLIPDRQAIIDSALAGFGTVGNDLMGQGCPYFDSSHQPIQDLERAKSLLKAAGRAGATFTLGASPATPGLLESAIVFAEQAKGAGITINVQQLSPSIYWTAAGGFDQAAFRTEYYAMWPSLSDYYTEYLSRGTVWNETFWTYQRGGAASQRLIYQATAETDPTRAADLWHEVQSQQINDGGILEWANADSVDLAAPNVKGLVESPIQYLNGRFQDAWIAQS